MEQKFRIRVDRIGEENTNLKFLMKQNYKTLDVMSLSIDTKNLYNNKNSNYGIVVGRVIANNGVGVPNVNVSIFVPIDGEDNEEIKGLYSYENVYDNTVSYNLLPNKSTHNEHSPVGTFYTKRDILDNKIMVEIFDKYYKYTTRTNEAGDYMIMGVPVGFHTLHYDADLSDIGFLSQRPTDMIYQGANIGMFDSPSKFKNDLRLESLPQIIRGDNGLNVIPLWGKSETDEIGITRYDINFNYSIKPTCIFIGSLISDDINNGINPNCTCKENIGKMDTLTTGLGNIEMIRKTPKGEIEDFNINGTELIDNDGTWCYQIPMNLNYVITNEEGELVHTADTNKGIPTRTSVRFRIGEAQEDDIAETTVIKPKVLIPSLIGTGEDYDDNTFEFGKKTNEEYFRDLLWNKVYTVKSYIPRLQKNVVKNEFTKNFLGIKSTNIYGKNNPVPYNNTTLTRNFLFGIICTILKFTISVVGWLNELIDVIAGLTTISCIAVEGLCEDNNGRQIVLAPKCGKKRRYENKEGEDYKGKALERLLEKYGYKGPMVGQKYMNCIIPETNEEVIIDINSKNAKDCIENNLAEEYNIINMDFYNDWLNGTIYLPKFKKKTKRKWKKDLFCMTNNSRNIVNSKITKPCAINKNPYGGKIDTCNSNSDCHKVQTNIEIGKTGLLTQIDGDDNFYLIPTTGEKEQTYNRIKLFQYDIVLLGSIVSNDIHKIPRLNAELPSSTFKIVPFKPELDYIYTDNMNTQQDVKNLKVVESGIDMYGLLGENDTERERNGLFYDIRCSNTRSKFKTCVNVERICEIGVGNDVLYSDLDNNETIVYPDGMITNQDMSNLSFKSLFATLNNRPLKYNENIHSYSIYQSDVNNINSFDGLLQLTGSKDEKDIDYIDFRYGSKNGVNLKFYDNNFRFPNYNNSFYFYFGLHDGKTAINKFNKDFYTLPKIDKVKPFKVDLTINDKIVDRVECGIKVDFMNSNGPYTYKIEGINGDIKDSSGSTENNTIYLNQIDLGLGDVNNDLNQDYKFTFTDVYGTSIIKYATIKSADVINFSYDVKHYIIGDNKKGSIILSNFIDYTDNDMFTVILNEHVKPGSESSSVFTPIKKEINILTEETLIFDNIEGDKMYEITITDNSISGNTRLITDIIVSVIPDFEINLYKDDENTQLVPNNDNKDTDADYTIFNGIITKTKYTIKCNNEELNVDLYFEEFINNDIRVENATEDLKCFGYGEDVFYYEMVGYAVDYDFEIRKKIKVQSRDISVSFNGTNIVDTDKSTSYSKVKFELKSLSGNNVEDEIESKDKIGYKFKVYHNYDYDDLLSHDNINVNKSLIKLSGSTDQIYKYEETIETQKLTFGIYRIKIEILQEKQETIKKELYYDIDLKSRIVTTVHTNMYGTDRLNTDDLDKFNKKESDFLKKNRRASGIKIESREDTIKINVVNQVPKNGYKVAIAQSVKLRQDSDKQPIPDDNFRPPNMGNTKPQKNVVMNDIEETPTEDCTSNLWRDSFSVLFQEDNKEIKYFYNGVINNNVLEYTLPITNTEEVSEDETLPKVIKYAHPSELFSSGSGYTGHCVGYSGNTGLFEILVTDDIGIVYVSYIAPITISCLSEGKTYALTSSSTINNSYILYNLYKDKIPIANRRSKSAHGALSNSRNCFVINSCVDVISGSDNSFVDLYLNVNPFGRMDRNEFSNSVPFFYTMNRSESNPIGVEDYSMSLYISKNIFDEYGNKVYSNKIYDSKVFNDETEKDIGEDSLKRTMYRIYELDYLEKTNLVDSENITINDIFQNSVISITNDRGGSCDIHLDINDNITYYNISGNTTSETPYKCKCYIDRTRGELKTGIKKNKNFVCNVEYYTYDVEVLYIDNTGVWKDLSKLIDFRTNSNNSDDIEELKDALLDTQVNIKTRPFIKEYKYDEKTLSYKPVKIINEIENVVTNLNYDIDRSTFYVKGYERISQPITGTTNGRPTFKTIFLDENLNALVYIKSGGGINLYNKFSKLVN